MNIGDLTPAVASLFCAVEMGSLFINPQAEALQKTGCLLGLPERCRTERYVPSESDVPPSPSPPNSTIKEYQVLATVAESYIEQTWWRRGFASDHFLLSHNDSELPRPQFVVRKTRHKKLKNIYQCVTRQQFIRKSYDFNTELDPAGFDKEEAKFNCTAQEHPDVIAFYKLWTDDKEKTMGGKLVHPDKLEMGWKPVSSDHRIREGALKVLWVFYEGYGGIWTGCFKFDRFPNCRGALAAAALVTSMHILTDITEPDVKSLEEHALLTGYFLASLGRGTLLTNPNPNSK